MTTSSPAEEHALISDKPMDIPPITLPHTDIDLLRLRLKLTPGQRLWAMDDARRLALAMKRGRLRSQFPELSDIELNLKVLEEIEYAKRLGGNAGIQPPLYSK